MKRPAKRRNQFRLDKEVRKLARERVGAVPPGQIIVPKTRKAPKHPKRERDTWLDY